MPLRLDGLDEIPSEERAAALDNWEKRMVSEHASARVFGAIVDRLMRAGVRRRHIVAVADMVGQELEHALLCARVVVALGGEAHADLPRLPPMPEHADALPIEAALRDIISVSCCSETVAVALVATEREQAGTPELRWILERILADEVKHARLGWKLLDELGPDLDPGMKRRLSAYLVAAFEHQIHFHAPFLAMPSASDRAVSLGAPDGPSNWEVFVQTIESTTVPGLERHGLAARRAWEIAQARLDRAA